jgi:hypothetical protein
MAGCAGEALKPDVLAKQPPHLYGPAGRGARSAMN